MTDLQKAILYMIFSAMSFSIVNAVVRSIDYFPTFELVFFRSIGSVVLCLIVLKKLNVSVKGNNQKLLFLRGIVGVSSLTLFYKAIQLMPLASAVSLRYLSPFFAAGLAMFFLKEKMKGLQWFFFATAFSGVILLKGFDYRISALGLACILASAFISGMVYVVIRKIGKTEHPVVVINYFLVIATLVGALGCLFNWQQPQGTEWLLLGSLGVFGFIAQYFMTVALQIAESNLITPFKYAEVIFTLITGFIFFGEYQTWIALLAMLIITLSLLANVWVKQNTKLKL